MLKLKKQTGKKFKINDKRLRGKPDIVFQKEKICVFLDSDFWHGWQYPKWKRKLKNDFWKKKIEGNRARDRKNTAYLRNNGWQVARIWGHEIKKDIDAAVSSVANLIWKYALSRLKLSKVAAKKLGKNYIGIDSNSEYVKIAEKRLQELDARRNLNDAEVEKYAGQLNIFNLARLDYLKS